MPTIYLDILITLNIFIDFLLLSATANILRLPQKNKRMLAGAFLGGLCSLFIFLPPINSVLLLLLKLLSAAVIILVSFKWSGKLNFLKRYTVFMIASAVFAGIASAIWFFAAPTNFYVIKGVVYYNVSPLMLGGLTVASYIFLYIYDKLSHKKVAPNRDYSLILDCGAGEVTLRVLYDTGHHLKDAFSGSPVAIVSLNDINPYLTEEQREALKLYKTDYPDEIKSAKRSDGGLALMTPQKSKLHLRMIPYTSVGGVGLLPAFKPDKAVLSIAGIALSGDKALSQDITGIFIALSDVLGRGDYQGIIGTDIANLLEK